MPDPGNTLHAPNDIPKQPLTLEQEEAEMAALEGMIAEADAKFYAAVQRMDAMPGASPPGLRPAGGFDPASPGPLKRWKLRHEHKMASGQGLPIGLCLGGVLLFTLAAELVKEIVVAIAHAL